MHGANYEHRRLRTARLFGKQPLPYRPGNHGDEAGARPDIVPTLCCPVPAGSLDEVHMVFPFLGIVVAADLHAETDENMTQLAAMLRVVIADLENRRAH